MTANSIDRNRNITLESNANFAVKQLTTFNNNLNNQLLTEHANGFKLFKKPPRAPNSTPVHRPKPKTEQEEDENVEETSVSTTGTNEKSTSGSISVNNSSVEGQPIVPRNFVVNRDPYQQPNSPHPDHVGVAAKQPPPPPPLRTRPSAINSRLKPSDSSFGLHSPDNLPLGFNPQDDKVQDLLKKLKTTKNFSENALVLDPDLIDLTMIPPPMTPDEVNR